MKQLALLLALGLISLNQHVFAQGMIVEVPLAERIDASMLIVEAEVISKRSYWNLEATNIYTNNTIRIFKILKGETESDQVILTHKGGKVGLQMLKVNPGIELHKGQKGIFFLYQITPIAAAQMPAESLRSFKAFAGTQGFIEYLKGGQKAIDPFGSYKDIQSQLYEPILNGRRFISLNSFNPGSYIAPGTSRLIPPVITSFTPDSLSAGNLMVLIISGLNFGASYTGSADIQFPDPNNGGASYLSIGGDRVVSWSDTMIRLTVPTRSGTGKFIVTNSGGESDSSATDLTVTYNVTNVLPYDSIPKLVDDTAGGFWFIYNTAFASDDSAVARFDEALDAWRCATFVNWEVKAPTTTTDSSLLDGFWLISYDGSDPLAAGALGTAFSYHNACIFSGDTNWVVREVDIFFDIAPTGGWYKGVTTSGIMLGESDFMSVALHELGHGHKLGHTINGGNVMHYQLTNGTTARTLQQYSEIDGGTFVMNYSADTNSCGPKPMINSTNCASCFVTLSMASTAVFCFGDSTGTATATPAGGSGSYTYIWNDGQSTATAVGLPSLTHFVTVTDSVGCSANNSVVVGTPTALSTSMDTTNVDCNGANNGLAIVTASGGTGGFTYLWSNLQTDDSALNLMPGSYVVTVADLNFCTIVDSVLITEPPAMSGVIALTHPLCFGDTNGVINITLGGGVPPYTYAWNTIPLQTDDSATGLNGGTYRVTVTDANLCIYVDSGTLVEPPPLVLSLSMIPVSCNGFSDGKAIAVGSGGTAAYSYIWATAPPQMDDTATGLSPGTYLVNVLDANLCTTEDTITVTEPLPIMLTLSKSDLSTCGGSDGMAIVAASGGVGGYTYSWNSSPVQNNDTAFNLPQGTYTATVLDVNSCSAMDSITVNDPLSITTGSIVTQPSCNGATDGSVTVLASGGTRPYTYLWNTIPPQTDSTATGLGAGSYTVTVTDSALCGGTETRTLTEPAVLTINTSSTNASFGASDGTATATPGGGTMPYLYLWNTTPAQTTSTATGLAAGTYIVTVTDIFSCTENASVAVGEETGIKIEETGVVLSIYPNPVGQFLYVKIQSPNKVTLQAGLYNLLGERILYQELPQNRVQELSFDLSAYPQGAYLLKLEIGDIQIVRKLMMAH